jgi:hypothetical protein
VSTRTASPKTYQNPCITLMAIAFVLLLAIGGLLALEAHDALSQYAWNGEGIDDVDAKQRQEKVGQRLALASLIPGSIFVILSGVRHEINRVLAARTPEARDAV